MQQRQWNDNIGGVLSYAMILAAVVGVLECLQLCNLMRMEHPDAFYIDGMIIENNRRRSFSLSLIKDKSHVMNDSHTNNIPDSLSNPQQHLNNTFFCPDDKENFGELWSELCRFNFSQKAASILQHGFAAVSNHEQQSTIHILQIGAHVGWEENDPMAKGMTAYLEALAAKETIPIPTTMNNKQELVHYTFVEASPTNYHALQSNIASHQRKQQDWGAVTNMKALNVGIIPDGKTNNATTMTFYSIRDTVDAITGLDRTNGIRLPYWATQISSFSKPTLLRNAWAWKNLGLDIEDFIEEIEIPVQRFSDLIDSLNPSPGYDHDINGGGSRSNKEEDEQEKLLLVLLDVEGLDCDIVSDIAARGSSLPYFLIYEFKHCHPLARALAKKKLMQLGYTMQTIGEDILAVRKW